MSVPVALYHYKTMSNLTRDLAAAIVETTNEIFSSMIFMEIEEIEFQRYKEVGVESNVSSMIGLGGQIRGSLDLHFPSEVAIAITSQFLGMEVDTIDEDVQDAIGELANMIAGGVKTFFLSREIETELAIPNTIVGKSYKTHGIRGAERCEITFSCPSGMFLAEMKYLVNS